MALCGPFAPLDRESAFRVEPAIPRQIGHVCLVLGVDRTSRPKAYLGD